MRNIKPPRLVWSLDDGIEIKIKHRDDFLKIAETLTRIGIVTGRNQLQQICHILHKKGKYYIVHYKCLLAMDGNSEHCFDVEDLEMQNKTAKLVQDWGLATIVNEQQVNTTEDVYVKVVPFLEKAKWTLQPQYIFGRQ